MPMRICSYGATDTREIQLDQTRQSREVADSASSPPAPAAAAGNSDSIALTGVSGMIQLALNAGTNERAGRVQQLKQLVDSNQYAIDPQTVSRALIGAHLTGD